MSFVSISRDALDRVVSDARGKPDEQVVGVLIGRLQDNTMVIERAVTGEIESDASHAMLPGDSIAKIADDIIKGRIKGNVIGWYHSHVKGGLFMSETDVETQLKLQQFSPMITAMVVDSNTGNVGYYRADQRNKSSVALPTDQVRVYGPGEAPSQRQPPQARVEDYYQPPPYRSPSPFGPKISLTTVIVVVVLIALVLSASLIAAVWFGAIPATGTLKIDHKPKTTGVVGNPITISANVTGGVSGLQGVVLRYALTDLNTKRGVQASSQFQEVAMLLTAAGGNTYAYTLPGSEVVANIEYQISATDKAGNVLKTDITKVAVGDFDFRDDEYKFTIYRTAQVYTGNVFLLSKNGFTRTISFLVEGGSIGVQVSPPSIWAPQATGNTPVPLNMQALDNAPVGEFTMTLKATYQVGAVQVIRQTTLKILITDFKLDRETSSQDVRGGTYNATYILVVTIYKGFSDLFPSGTTQQLRWELRGLPNNVEWIIEPISFNMLGDGSVVLRFKLTIITHLGSETGLFRITVNLTFNNVQHHLDQDLDLRIS